MELRHLRYFVAVAEELHFGRAARRLAVSQPPLSMAVKDLEDELGVRLFERSSRSVRLTVPGQEFVQRARDVLGRADAAVQDARRAGRGELGRVVVGYSTAATYDVLAEVLTAFRLEHPRVALQLLEMKSLDQVAALEAHAIDVGFACMPVAAGELRVVTLREEPLVVAMPKRHPLARRPAIAPRELLGHAAVVANPAIEPGWANRATAALAAAGVVLRVVQEADSKLAVLSLVASGLGFSVLAASTAKLGRAGVVFRPLQLKTHLRLSLLLRREETNPALEPFVAIAIAACRRGKSGDPRGVT